MNSRMLQIMSILAKEDNNSLSSLSKQFNVTERTIRNDIKKISEFLIMHNLSPLSFDKYGIVLTNNDFGQYRQYVNPNDYYNYRLSKKERILISSIILLCKSDYITLSDIADHLFVSRTTIVNDLPNIRHFLSLFNIELISHPSKGLKITGTELNIRDILLNIFSPNNRANDSFPFNLLRQIKPFNTDYSKIIVDILKTTEQELHIEFDDESIVKLIIYLNIMIERNHQNKYIEFLDQSDNDRLQYNCAFTIISNIHKCCEIEMKEGEINYLADKLGTAFIYKSTVKGTRQSIAIQVLTKQLINDVSNDLNINLDNDYQFYENLSNHLISIYYNTIHVEKNNPLLNEIKNSQKRLIDIIKKNITTIENYYQRKLNETELLYIVIHFSAAIERLKSLKHNIDAIIVCNSGVATSQFLKEKLQSIYKMNIIATISKYELESLDLSLADIIITTVPLYNTPIKTIQVSTNLSQTDYAIIGTELNKLQNQKMKVDYQSEKNMLNLSTIMDTINPLLFSEISPKSMAEEISAKISNALINNINPKKAKHDVPYLFEFLTPEFIRLDVECTDWQNAIKISGQPLLKKGYINQHYIDSIIDITNNLGPYYIIGPNIALPHAGIDDGCFKTGMSMIRLSHPVNINTKKGEPIMIKYFVFLCSSDEKSHLQAFFHLLSLIHDTDILKEMDDISNSRTMNYLLQIREIELKNY